MPNTETITPSQRRILTAPSGPIPFGWLAYLGAGVSILICYGESILVSTVGGIVQPAASASRTGLEFNPHVQAVLMWMFGLLAVYGLAQDRKTHGRRYPLILAIAGVAVIILTLYGIYRPAIEMAGYMLLIVAAFSNQNVRLRQLNEEVASLNNTLEHRVAEQVSEIERLARLKRFLAPSVAQLITDQQEKTLFESHRRGIAALFCDIRGFTMFSEQMEPEEVMTVLQGYHQRMGQLVAKYGGTIDHRAGDGMMVFFNDPLPCEQPVVRAVELALAMRETFAELDTDWAKRGYELGFGVGIASGYATLGVVGFEGRYDYTANGNVVNLASRLCDEASNGQILISHKAYIEAEDQLTVEPVGKLEFKGFARAVAVYNVQSLND